MPEPVSLRLKPNLLKSGEKATVKAEFLPPRVIGQRCRLRLVEVDDDGKHPVRLAEFMVTPSGGAGALRFSAAERQLGKDESAAPPGKATPFVKLAFDGLPDEHVVRVELPRTAAEGRFFELALTLDDPAGQELSPAGKPLPFARLDCGPGRSDGSVALWAEADAAGKPSCTPLELTRVRDHAAEIWNKNGFQLEWRVVTPEEAQRVVKEKTGPRAGFCKVTSLGLAGTGSSSPNCHGSVNVECELEEAYVVRETSADVDPLYRTGFLVAHEVLHQFVAYGAWYLFGERLRARGHDDYDGMRMDEWTHESRPFEKEETGAFPTGMQNLNCEGTLTYLKPRRSDGLPPIEQILHRQRRLLRTLFAEVEGGTLGEWRKLLLRWHRERAQKPARYSVDKDLLWSRSFEWKRFYEPCAERGPGPEAPVPLLELRDHIRELEEACKAEGEARLAKAKALYDEAKGPWYKDDDEAAFRKALSLLQTIDPGVKAEDSPKVRNFAPTPAQQDEITRLTGLCQAEL